MISRGKTRERATSPKGSTASTVSPVRGLNTRDPLAAMNNQYAVAVQNFIATPQGLQVREGYTKHATGLDGYVTTIMSYKGNSTASDKLFACTESKIYDVTNVATSPAPMQSGLISGLWEYTNFVNTIGNHYLVACNGVDTARFWNGTAWANFTFNATPSADGQITTGSMTNLEDWKQVITHQQRIWITHNNSSILHYLPINQVAGEAKQLPVTFKRGGSIASISSMSVDLGFGLMPYLVVASTSGDVVLYSGTDPSSVSTWQRAGEWALAEPVGTRSLYPWRSDCLTLTQDGLYELSTACKSSRVDNAAALSLAIQPTIAQLVSSFSTLPGFQLIHYPGKNLLILNVPQINAEANFQFVYNTITQGWTQFTNWPAQCWGYLNKNLFFGGNGFVAKAFNGYTDAADSNGNNGNSYVAYVQQAFDNFEFIGQKHFKMARPNLTTAVATPRVFVDCNTDFSLKQPFTTASVPPNKGNVWDVAVWDVSTWGYGGQNFNEWQTISGIGYTASLTMAISVNDYTLWTNTDWIYEKGGVLG